MNAYSDALRSHAKGWKDSGVAENVADKQSDDAGNSSENGGEEITLKGYSLSVFVVFVGF